MIRNIGSPVALIYVWISNVVLFDYLDLDKFLSSLLPPTVLLSLFFWAKSDDPVVFNIEISDAAILLKPQMNYQ